jgi:hypothetical protein
LTIATSVIDFLGSLLKIESITHVSYALYGPTLHIWILFSHDDEDAMREAVMAERELRRSPDSELIDVHYFALDEIDQELLPPATTFFLR